MIIPYLCLVTTGLIWGVTMPLMKKGCKGVVSSSSSKTVISNVLMNPDFLIPFILNKLSSVLYVSSLTTFPATIALPTCHSLTVLTSLLIESFYFKMVSDSRKYVGFVFIAIGTGICLYGSPLPALI